MERGVDCTGLVPVAPVWLLPQCLQSKTTCKAAPVSREWLTIGAALLDASVRPIGRHPSPVTRRYSATLIHSHASQKMSFIANWICRPGAAPRILPKLGLLS